MVTSPLLLSMPLFNRYGYGCLLLLLASLSLQAQQPTRLTTLLAQVEQHYPALKSARYQTEALRKTGEIIQTTARPSLDASYQANLATYNNITGLFYPTYVLPISGPPSTSNRFQPVTGSAASLLLTWQPLTFGARPAQLAVAQGEVAGQEAQVANTLFGLKIQVISAYLDVLLANELIGVYTQNVERANALLTQSRVLVATGIRSSADTALFRGEVSRTTVDVLQARQALRVAHINLTELTGVNAPMTGFDSTYFQRLPIGVNGTDSVLTHPALRVAQQQVAVSGLKETLIQKALLPKLTFWGTTYGRGSGVSATGDARVADGLLFSRVNYGAGLQLSLPLLNGPEVRLRGQQQRMTTQGYSEDVNQTRLHLSVQQQIARAALQNAGLIAAELPTQVQSARTAYTNLTVRYREGLATLADLAQAQYALVRSETDLRRAYWSAWKALLQQAAATGDLSIFLNQTP